MCEERGGQGWGWGGARSPCGGRDAWRAQSGLRARGAWRALEAGGTLLCQSACTGTAGDPSSSALRQPHMQVLEDGSLSPSCPPPPPAPSPLLTPPPPPLSSHSPRPTHPHPSPPRDPPSFTRTHTAALRRPAGHGRRARVRARLLLGRHLCGDAALHGRLQGVGVCGRAAHACAHPRACACVCGRTCGIALLVLHCMRTALQRRSTKREASRWCVACGRADLLACMCACCDVPCTHIHAVLCTALHTSLQWPSRLQVVLYNGTLLPSPAQPSLPPCACAPLSPGRWSHPADHTTITVAATTCGPAPLPSPPLTFCTAGPSRQRLPWSHPGGAGE